jgi:hypothetical protein
MANRGLDNQIRGLVDTTVPATPWLEDRVMAAIREDAVGRQQPHSRGRDLRFILPAVAAIVIAALLVGVMVGSRIAFRSPIAPANHPSPALASYRAMLDRDLRQVLHAHSVSGGGTCLGRSQCIKEVQTTQQYVATLVQDVAGTPPPPGLSGAAANVSAAANAFDQQMKLEVAAMQVPGSDFVDIYLLFDPTQLQLAVGVFECWPAVPQYDASLNDRYRCNFGPT